MKRSGDGVRPSETTRGVPQRVSGQPGHSDMEPGSCRQGSSLGAALPGPTALRTRSPNTHSAATMASASPRKNQGEWRAPQLLACPELCQLPGFRASPLRKQPLLMGSQACGTARQTPQPTASHSAFCHQCKGTGQQVSHRLREQLPLCIPHGPSRSLAHCPHGSRQPGGVAGPKVVGTEVDHGPWHATSQQDRLACGRAQGHCLQTTN